MKVSAGNLPEHLPYAGQWMPTCCRTFIFAPYQQPGFSGNKGALMKMMKARLSATALGLAALGLLAGAAQAQVQTQTQAQTQTQGTPRKATAVVDLPSAIVQTAAVVEGTVTDIRHDYSEADGPWTAVTLSDVKSHFGATESVVTIRHFGGRLPNGRQLVVAELPLFVKDKRYVVFLRNTAWNLSPVLGDLALRTEKIGDKEVLVNTDGIAVTGVGPMGLQMGSALFEGPQLDGSASKALGRDPAAFERQPLDRQGFVQALQTAMAASRLAVEGTVAPLPAGEFKWRAVPAAASADGASSPAASAASADRTAPEIDASRPAR